MMFVHLRIVKPGFQWACTKMSAYLLRNKKHKQNKETATDRMLEDFEGNTLNGVIG